MADDDTKPQETWPRVVKLRHPIDFGDQRILQLEMRRGRAGDIKGLKIGGEMPTEHLFAIASRMSGQPIRVIEMLDVEDAGEVMALAIDFYGLCLGAGKTR
jgi:Phage tail assembly chaperone proteins, E, or 41 or 14